MIEIGGAISIIWPRRAARAGITIAISMPDYADVQKSVADISYYSAWGLMPARHALSALSPISYGPPPPAAHRVIDVSHYNLF